MNITNLFLNINPREVLKNLPDAVFVIDSDGRISWVNDKAAIIFEANKKDLTGLYFNEIVTNGVELAEKSYSRRNSVVTGAYTTDGKEFFVEMNAKKYIEQYFVTIRDITAMTNVLVNAEKTGRLNKEKNIMLTKLSTDIKSPLQSIIGFSQALLDGMGGSINDRQEKYVKIINKNSSDLMYFMEKLLEFSQAESSLFTYSNRTFDLVNTIQTIVKNNEKKLSEKNLTVNYDFDDFDKKAVFLDEDCLRIIFQNIFDTSIRLTEVGAITIKIDTPDDETIEKYGLKPIDGSYFRILIQDTGIGLSSIELEGLFEPYTNLDKSHKKVILRSIVLGTAQIIAKRLGGLVLVKSEVMKGSAFSIVLPKNAVQG